ncbi:MAG: cupredoxin domain-containing protein [Parcubacteria group bacterium]|nr:cupredoxin domain-containing protein [Parcubacteria group bacterium]
MNKYIYLIIAMVVILGVGVAYKNFGADKSKAALTTGVVKEITIRAEKNKWNWSPEDITVNQGDTVKLTIINEDEYDHGIAIDAYGISQRVPALGTIEAEFVATQPGDFPFYCSVPCGEGDVDGKKRGHFDQVGKIHVTHMMMDGKMMEGDMPHDEMMKTQ